MSKDKKEIIALVGISFALDNYLTNHATVFKKKYEVKLVKLDKSFLLKKIYSRRSIFTLPFELILTGFILLNSGARVVVTVGPKPGLIVSILTYFTKNITHIHWFTGQVWATKSFYSSLAFISDFIISRLSNHLCCDGYSQKVFLKNKLNISKDIHVPIYGTINGVNTKFYCTKNINKSSSKTVVCFVGRISKEKGVEDLIEVASFFDAEKFNGEVQFTIAGPVDKYFNGYSDWLKKASAINCLTIIANFVDPLLIFKKSDILILPSFREGFGNIVIEAQASGLCIIASDVYGLRDSFVNKFSGYQCEAGNVMCFIDKVLKLHLDKKLFTEMQLNAINFSKKFQEDVFRKDLKNLYKSIGII